MLAHNLISDSVQLVHSGGCRALCPVRFHAYMALGIVDMHRRQGMKRVDMVLGICGASMSLCCERTAA